MSLANKKIVITRAKNQAYYFAAQLKKNLAIPFLYPCLQTKKININPEITQYLTMLEKKQFDWIIFTSANAVKFFSDTLLTLLPNNIKIAAIGSTTAAAINRILKLKVDLTPNNFDAKTLAAFCLNIPKSTILLPQSNLAKPFLKNSLEENGMKVIAPIIYQTVKADCEIKIDELLKLKQIDVITFLSPSAVNFFIEKMNDEKINISEFTNIAIACIGNVTKNAAEKAGFKIQICPSRHTVDGIITAISEYYA